MPTRPVRRPSADARVLDRLWNEPVERATLPNGLTLIVKPDESVAVCSVQVWVKTGSIHEGGLLGGGLSHYLEHLLFKGTERRAGREISAVVQAHGGYINAYTTFDRTVYYIDLPSEHVGVAIDLLADAVLRSTLPPEEVEREKQVILREIDMTLDEPETRLAQALFETAFREHPYRQPVIGHRAVFERVTRDDLVAYYRARYVPNNLVVVVVGAVQPAAVRAAVDEHFGGVPRSRLAPQVLPAEPLALAPREAHLFEDVQVARAGLGWQIPGLTHPDTPALDLLGAIVGQGQSSILWQQLREKRRLVHGIEAYAWNPGSVGLFFVSLLADPDKRAAAVAAVQEELARVAERGVPAARLRQAIRQAVMGEINTRKTMAGQASRLGVAEVVVGDLGYSREYFERLGAVTPAAVREAAARYLVPARLTVVTLNPKSGAGSGPTVRPAPAAPGEFEEVALPGGATLLLLRDPRLPNLHLRVAALGGCLQEPPSARGAIGLLASLLTKDTRRRSAAAVARTIEEVGGTFAEFSGNNTFGLMGEVLPRDLDRLLDLLGEGMHAPAFRAATLEIERAAALAALGEEADDVVTWARKELRRRFFGDHPFGIDAHGSEEGLKAVNADVLRGLRRQLLVSGNVVLAAAGDLDPARVRSRLERLLAGLPRGERAPTGPAFTGPVPADHEATRPRQQAVVLQAFPGPGVRADDYLVSEVADELFSGMASNLFERVRDQKGLAYFVRSARAVGLDCGMFAFFAGTSPAQADEVRREIEEEIRRVQDGAFLPGELARCRTRLKAARRMGLQSNGARAMQAALNALYGQPVNDWRHYDERIDAIDEGAVAAFARRYLVPERRVRLLVRP